MTNEWELPFDNNRHDHRSSTRQKVTVFCNLTTKYLNEFSPFDTRICEDRLFIGVTDSFEDFLMDAHHLMGVNESTGIDKNMSDNGSSLHIFFNYKRQHSIFCQFFSILEDISCLKSNRIFVEKESIKSKAKGMFRRSSFFEFDNLPYFDGLIRCSQKK